MNPNQVPTNTPWWGEYRLDPGQTGQWRVGPLSVSVQRQAAEWHICQLSDNSDIEELDTADVQLDAEPLGESSICHRHVVRPSKKLLQVVPALADRPVVTRPLTPFHLYPGQEVRLFVGTTVWMQVLAYKLGPLMLDIPVQRPSDTWFGRSTRDGEICYAARTHARLELSEVPLRAFRAITPVKITNKGEEPLLLERLMLPIPHLSVFAGANGRLWTEELSILCDEEMTSAHLHLGKGAPAIAEGAQRLTGPRTPPERGVLIRALGAIFG